jgi:tyrosyl-tRNA synthetase
MGGADQWGNITAGLELIRRRGGVSEGAADPAHGLAYKLLLSPSGAKFGKSEGGESVWLDAARTSPFAFYQYWLNTDDRDVGTYLRWFTEFPREEISRLDEAVVSRPEAREAQRALARDITARTHGDSGLREAEAATEAVFSGSLVGLSPEALAALDPVQISVDSAWTITQFAVASNSAPSNSQVRRLASQGGLYINDERITDPDAPLPEPLHGRFWVVRTGKRNTRIVERA